MNNTINIINTSLAFKCRIDDYNYWNMHLKHGLMSSMEIQIDNERKNAECLAKGNIIYNRDELNYPMRISERDISIGQEGDTKTVFAFDVYIHFKDRVANDTTSDYTYTSQTTEYIIKDLINKAIVTPTDTDRDISWLSVESSTTLGSTINYTVAPQGNLYDTIVELLAIDNLGLYATKGSSTIEIDCYEGADRSQGNTDGNKPVTFSVDFNNLISGQETSSNTFNVNVAYVGGVDSSGNRIIQKVGSATGADRKELAVDGGDVSDTTELTAIGNSSLKTTEDSGTYIAAVTEDDSFTYGEDFFLGDTVTIVGIDGTSKDLQILEVEIIREQGNYKQINLTFGQAQIKDTTQVDSNTQRITSLEQKISTGGGTTDGWLEASETWTYSSTDDPTGIFTISGDYSGVYSAGMKIKFTNNSNVIYGIILTVAYSSPTTTVTFLHEIDYPNNQAVDLMVSGTISDNYYSPDKVPYGFTVNKNSWTIKHTDTAYFSQSSPALNTYYNVMSGAIPIGAWKLSGNGLVYGNKSGSGESTRLALSTSSTTASDNELVTSVAGYDRHMIPHSVSKIITLTTKTTYYINVAAGSSGMSVIRCRGDITPTLIQATCAYI